MRKSLPAILLSIFAVMVIFCVCFAAAPEKVNKILVNTPLYQAPDFASEKVLDEIKQNEVVQCVEEEVSVDENGREWVRITYSSKTGYVPKSYLYLSAGTEDSNFKVVKATGKSSSEKIKLYSYYQETSEVIGTVVDGEKLNLVSDGKTYGDFSKIVYDGKECYVKTENITTGLTYNQRLALIISVSLVCGLLLIGVISVIVFHKKKKIEKPE